MTQPKTCLPGIVNQTQGGKFQTFSNKDNIKNTGNSYAQALIHGKKQPLNRPSTITANTFKAELPTGALITKIVVKYKHSKAPYNNKNCNVQAPTITLMNGNKPFKYTKSGYERVWNNATGNWTYKKANILADMSKKGKAPTTTAKEESVSFSNDWNYDVINPSTFGVKIDYPTNANNNEGYIRLYYVKVEIHYKTSSYGLNVQQVSGEYNGDLYTLYLDISNINRTNYNPMIKVTSPIGFILEDFTAGEGTTNQVSPRLFTYTPKFDTKTANQVLVLRYRANVTYASGVDVRSFSFDFGETVTSTSVSKTVTVKKTRPVDPTIDPGTTDNPTVNDQDTKPEDPQILFIEKDKEFTLDVTFDEDLTYVWGIAYDTTDNYESTHELNEDVMYYSTVSDQWRQVVTDYGGGSFISARFDVSNRQVTNKFKVVEEGLYILQITNNDSSTIYKQLNIYVYPSNLTTPCVSVLSPSKEECDRLGSGYKYTVQSFMKEITSDPFVRDWSKNFRIGVFNNPILANVRNIIIDDEEISYDSTDYDNLSISDIVNNAEYWSEPPKTVNTFENIECQFPYNKDYPLHILIVGDYSEATTPATLYFTEPCIVETDNYTTREANGTFPTPIDNLVLDSDSSEMVLSALNESNTLVFYDLPLDDDYGTNDEIAVRGLELSGTLEQSTDNMVLSATLKNSKNESRQRSLVLDELQTTLTDENQFHIGGIGDLWGFSTLDIINLEDWEAHLQIGNTLNETTGTVNLKDVKLTIYIENIDPQDVRTFINGEDLSYYGAFLTDLKVPEGLKTDTDYLNVNGTDVNDPFRQNIREKTIEATFEVGDCDLEGSTNTLREITRLLVNERDKYNRPIPNRLEFSHYPDVYWEYILEDVLDNEIDISTYTVKAKLVIPAGTAYDKNPTKTSTTGYISGLAHIRPIIQFKPSGTVVKIIEQISGQEFDMSYNSDWNGKIVEIDCDNRIVLLKEDDDDNTGEDISSYVDFSSDWFRLLGEYNFTSTGCAIATVISQERW